MLTASSDPPPLTCRDRLDCRAARISLIAAATSLDFPPPPPPPAPPPPAAVGGDVSGAGEGGGSREENVLRGREPMERMLERRFCSAV